MLRNLLLFGVLVVGAGQFGCRTIKTVACDSNDPVSSLGWLNKLVTEMEKDPVGNKDAKITSFVYYNRTVFYIQNRCCDIPNELYDCDGNKLCEPDGGITGKGDGKCTDFFEKREGHKPVWPPKTRKFSP